MPSVPSEKRAVATVKLTFRHDGHKVLYDDNNGKMLDVALPADDLRRDTVAFLRTLIDSASEDTQCRMLLRIVGRQMFEYVFGTGMPRQGAPTADDPFHARRRIEQRLQWAREEPHRFLLLRLEFENPSDVLALWPWEFLYYPQGDDGWNGYFVAEKRVVVLREMQTQEQVESAPPPVTVLLAISEPESARAAVDGEAIEHILAAHQPENVTLEVRRNLRFGQLKEEIGKVRPEVFHFHGHGSDDGGVYLPRRRRMAELRTVDQGFSATPPESGVATPGETVSALFANHHPKLVVFTACRTAAQEVAFQDVAQQLANEGIPAVVAMQFRVSVEAALWFCESFYSSLLRDREWIEAAFAAGLSRLAAASAEFSGELANRTVGTPVLFMNRTGGRLLPPAEEPARGSGPSTQAHLCPFCGTEISARKFCSECGKPAACPKCHTPYVGGGKFCTECGTPVPGSKTLLTPERPPRAGSGDIGVEETTTA